MEEIRLVSNLIINLFPTKNMIGVGVPNTMIIESFILANWKIAIFEADKKMLNVLENFKRKQIKRRKNHLINLHQYVVSNRSLSFIPFYTSTQIPNISSIMPFHNSHVYTYDVNSVRLDDFYKNKVLIVNFLYIQTRGNDLNVLLSYPWDIYKPDVIMCEFDDRKTERIANYNWKQIASFLQVAGYFIVVSEWYPIIEYGQEYQWRCFKTYPCELEDKNGWGRLISFKDKNLLTEFLKMKS